MKKWVKSLFSPSNIFATLGFVFQYVVPLALFSTVIPYTHGAISAGLTKTGWVAVAILCLVLVKKAKEKILSKPKSITRGVILSIFPILLWFAVNLVVDYIVGFIADFAAYWDKVILFILIGRLFYTIHEAEAAANGRDE